MLRKVGEIIVIIIVVVIIMVMKLLLGLRFWDWVLGESGNRNGASCDWTWGTGRKTRKHLLLLLLWGAVIIVIGWDIVEVEDIVVWIWLRGMGNQMGLLVMLLRLVLGLWLRLRNER